MVASIPLPDGVVNSIMAAQVDNADKTARAAEQKAIAENLKLWTSTEIDANRDDDRWTARDRIIQRKLLSHANPRKLTMGKAFFDYLKQTFRSAEAPENQLVAAGGDGPIQTKLLEAMVAYKRTGDRPPMPHGLSLVKGVNSTEATCLMGIVQRVVPQRLVAGGAHRRATFEVLPRLPNPH